MGQVSAKGIGDQVSRGASALNKSIVAVNIVKWGVVPGAVGGFLYFLLLVFLGVSLTGSAEYRMCDDTGGNCKVEKVSRRWNILWYIIGIPVVAIMVGGMCYQLGFMISNPKLTAGVATGHLVKGIFS